MKRYEIIYADPPWQFKDQLQNGNRGAVCKYPVMSVDDIKALPVPNIAADNCLLAMWWVSALPAEALAVVEAWGFTFKTMKGLTWVKQTKTGLPFFGMGHWTRAGSEDCLFAVRGKPKRIDASVRQVIFAPVGKHSEKPPEARDRLTQLMGGVPRVELFARQQTPGWDVWGNEVESSFSMP